MELYGLVIITALGIPLLIAFVAWFEERTSPAYATETETGRGSATSPALETRGAQGRLDAAERESPEAPTPLTPDAEQDRPEEQRPAA
jgi:hypothetical protein